MFNANKVDSKTEETKIRTASENSFPEIEKMTPFIDTGGYEGILIP